MMPTYMSIFVRQLIPSHSKSKSTVMNLKRGYSLMGPKGGDLEGRGDKGSGLLAGRLEAEPF